MKRGKYDEAESRFRRCLSITPYYHYAHTNLAIVLATKGDKMVPRPRTKRRLVAPVPRAGRITGGPASAPRRATCQVRSKISM
jgi:hypothetical protein